MVQCFLKRGLCAVFLYQVLVCVLNLFLKFMFNLSRQIGKCVDRSVCLKREEEDRGDNRGTGVDQHAKCGLWREALAVVSRAL